MNYLYNGIELPDINEVWDKEKYPYAIIFSASDSLAFLHLTHDATHITQGIFKELYYTDQYARYRADGNGWEVVDPSKLEVPTFIFPSNVKWSNYDILDVDGSVYLKASDPIPVGSAPTLEPTSMLMGWLVGRAVASQRGKA